MARLAIRSHIKNLIENTELTAQGDQETMVNSEKTSSALEFVYNLGSVQIEFCDVLTEFENYLAEPQLKFYLSPCECWKTQEKNIRFCQV